MGLMGLMGYRPPLIGLICLIGPIGLILSPHFRSFRAERRPWASVSTRTYWPGVKASVA